MKKWQSIPTLGFTKVASLILMTSAITMGSSIASPISPLANPISAESTSCRRENQEEQREELQASQTGSDTLEALKNLNRILSALVEILSEEKS